MLLFISLANAEKHDEYYFNTSHVTVYHLSCIICRNSNDFNTSHVTVYPLTVALIANTRENFNTSHVTVYQYLPF